MPQRALLPLALLIALFAAPGARADLAQLKAACEKREVTDAPGRTFRFCDDGVPAAGGRTPNPGADRAIAVPAAYAGVDGLPPADPAAAATVPGNAGGTVALDVDLSLPDPEKWPVPEGGYPLVAIMHGCCSGSKRAWESDAFDHPGERWHYNNAWWAARGYVVVTWTSRGFVNGSNQGSTGEMHINSQRYEINDFQHLVGQLVDDGGLHVDPDRIVVTGGSYGGGMTWSAFTDPIWKSPGGREIELVAAAPKYGWTDLLSSLTPTGRQFYDEGPPPATDGSDTGMRGSKVGIPIRSIINGLFLAGDLGVPTPPPNNAHTTFPDFIRQAFYCTQSTYPAESNPLCESARAVTLPALFGDSSAYYRNDFFEKLRTDRRYRTPVFSAGTLTDPLFPPIEHRRMVERLKAAVPGYPVKEYYGDYNHFVQNKGKEWADLCGEDRHRCTVKDHPGGNVELPPDNRVRIGVTTRLNRFVDHYAKPPAAPKLPKPRFDVTTAVQICPATASERFPADGPGETFTADSFDALSPGRMAVDWDGGGQAVLSRTGDTHARRADPVLNTATNGSRCATHDEAAGAGVAVYETEPLPRETTLAGGTILTVDYTANGDLQALQLNARLYDVQESGQLVLVDRGPRRIDPAKDGIGKVTFQLHGNAWRFAKGHRIHVELAADDDPYLHASDSSFALSLSKVRMEMPVRETAYGLDPTPPPSGADTTPPRVRLKVVRRARRALRVRVRCSETCGGRLTARARGRRAGARRVRLRGPGRKVVRVKVRRGTPRRLRLRLRVADPSGNRARLTRRVARRVR